MLNSRTAKTSLANMIPNKYNTTLKLVVFSVHFGFSIFLMDWYYNENKCDNRSNRANYYQATAFDGSTRRSIYPVLAEDQHKSYRYNEKWDAEYLNTDVHCRHNVSNATALCMFKGVMPSADVTYLKDDYMLGGVNNMVFLMMLFEWITAAFALDYLASTVDNVLVQLGGNAIALCWNICLFVFSLAYVKKLPFNNMIMGWLLALVAMARQVLHMNNLYVARQTKDKSQITFFGYVFDTKAFTVLNRIFGTENGKLNPITTRYFEYALTAPVLLIAVQSIVTQADGWAYLVAYTCMVVTNLLGIPLQKSCVYALEQKGSTDTPVYKNNIITMLMTLLVSWLAFATSWLVYFNDISYFFVRFPTEIQFLVVLLPLFFASFGFCGTLLCVQLALGQQSLATFTAQYMDVVYDILSMIVKILVVIIVWSSNEFKPNSGCSD
jgi:hypothetical protein